MEQELLPCPFCGGMPSAESKPHGTEVAYFLCCRSCGAEGPWLKSGEVGAQRLWNRRVDDTESIKEYINRCLTISLDDLDSFERTGDWGELGNKIISVRDTQEHLLEILGKIWALIYHGNTESWEYSGQILNHIRVELEDRQAKIDRMWIPVSERLPSAIQSVLVQFQDGEISVTYRAKQMRGSTLVVDWMLGNPNDVVVAWQPLPKPYEATNE